MGAHQGSSFASAPPSSSRAATASSSAPASTGHVTDPVPAAQGGTSTLSSTRTPTTLTHLITTSTGNSSSTLTPTTLVQTVSSGTPTFAANSPLTTIFTPPARCAHVEYTFFESQSGTSTFWHDLIGPAIGTQSPCYPPGFAAQASTNVQYSPGVCPSGYLPASSSTAPSQSAITSWCCRSGLKYAEQAEQTGCYTTISTPTVVRLNAASTTTMSAAFVAADWPIQVAWNSADLNLFTPASAPLIEASAAAANSTQSNMTGQEIAGLGIGVPAAVAAIAVACYALWRRKRRQPRDAELLDDRSEMEQTYSTWTPEPKRTDTPHIEVPVPTVQSRRFDIAYTVGEPGPSYSTSYSPPDAPLDETEPPAEPR